MLKKEKELFINFFGNSNILNGVLIVFALFLFGAFYTYYNIETAIEQKHLVDIYAKNPKIENHGVGRLTYLTFKSTTQKDITFRLESQYIKSYDKSYLFSFDKEDKRYKLKVLKTELDHAQNGDVLNLYSILDETRIYLTLEEYKKTKKLHYLESFQTCVLFASIFFAWIIVLLIKKKRVTLCKSILHLP